VVDDTPYAAEYDASSALLTITGSVDELSGPTFRTDLEKYSDGFERDLTVDLTGVDFFPSLAIGVLAVAAKNARNAGHQLDVVAAPGTIVARVLTISNLPFREQL
jgi:anti-anti-sigma factor